MDWVYHLKVVNCHVLFQRYKLATHQGSAAYLWHASLNWRSLAATCAGGTHYLIPDGRGQCMKETSQCANCQGFSFLKSYIHAATVTVGIF